MNIVLGIILFVLCILFGYVKADKYIKRRKFYFDFYTFNKKIKTEIEFSQNTLTKLIKNQEQNDFTQSFEHYISTNNFEFEKNYLSDEDKLFYRNYLEIIGTGDKHSQIQFIDKISEQIDSNYTKSQDDEKKYKTLYIKVSFLVGLMLLILFL